MNLEQPPADPDQSDLQRMRAGDAEAFESLVRRHRPFIRAVCRRVIGEGLADDALQEVLIKLQRHGHAIHGMVPAWLHTCAVNTARDLRRSEHRRRIYEARAGSQETLSGGEAEAVVESGVLDDVLADLPAGDRAVIVAYFFDGRDMPTIAAAEGISKTAVKKRLDGALGRLRRLLKRRGVAVGALALLTCPALRADTGAPLPPLSETLVESSGWSGLALVGGVIGLFLTAGVGLWWAMSPAEGGEAAPVAMAAAPQEPAQIDLTQPAAGWQPVMVDFSWSTLVRVEALAAAGPGLWDMVIADDFQERQTEGSRTFAWRRFTWDGSRMTSRELVRWQGRYSSKAWFSDGMVCAKYVESAGEGRLDEFPGTGLHRWSPETGHWELLDPPRGDSRLGPVQSVHYHGRWAITQHDPASSWGDNRLWQFGGDAWHPIDMPAGSSPISVIPAWDGAGCLTIMVGKDNDGHDVFDVARIADAGVELLPRLSHRLDGTNARMIPIEAGAIAVIHADTLPSRPWEVWTLAAGAWSRSPSVIQGVPPQFVFCRHGTYGATPLQTAVLVCRRMLVEIDRSGQVAQWPLPIAGEGDDICAWAADQVGLLIAGTVSGQPGLWYRRFVSHSSPKKASDQPRP